MLRKIKRATLGVLREAGAFNLVADSHWRRERLLILCYHGISLDDEHLWRPSLYMPAEVLEKRLETLQTTRCSVLPLDEALARLRSRDLLPRSVAITFDDGGYDFYKRAHPLLRKYGFPATVYQTTYYCEHEVPIFNLICSYLLWKRRGEKLEATTELGLAEPADLSTELGRHRIVRALIELSDRENLNGQQRNELAGKLAAFLGIDYAALTSARILQLMNAREVADVARQGVDVQLHTHRHRTPEDEGLFRREINENQEKIRALTGKEATHFCYPRGAYREEFTGWLQKENIRSATTCDAGLAERSHNPYLLPRFVDTAGRTQVEFESWLSGVGSLVALRKAAPKVYIPQEDSLQEAPQEE
jgi:peptidoglycan/xylan/chitin deacetylase (PgdA/CDA1 family)